MFWFTVRLETANHTPPADTPLARLQGRRVLIVDDHAASRLALQYMLTAWGVEHASAVDGLEAMHMLHTAVAAEAPYDLAIIDQQMPGSDSLQLVQVIKATPALADLQLVLLTPWGQKGKQAGALKAGIAGCLTKPVRYSQLYHCLTTTLGITQMPAEPDADRQHASATRMVRRAHILLAEDNVVNQKVAVALLTKLGYQTDVANNGLEAVAAFTQYPYDLVLMDCQMPVLDGFAASEQIRTQEGGGRHTPIIAMTASAMQGDRERCLAAGMDDYLPKPVPLAMLREKLARWLPATPDILSVSEIVHEEDVFTR